MPATLYSRLGGYDTIATFATKLIAQMQSDSVLRRFWTNRCADWNARERQHLINYLVQETGGQMYYTGREMALAHEGLQITEVDWQRFIEIVSRVAGELGVSAMERGEVIAFLDRLKGDIVTS